MKTIFISLVLAFCLVLGASAQTARHDVALTGSYHINVVFPLGEMTMSGTFTNNSRYDYKDITYQIQFLAGDGTVMDTKTYTWYEFIGHGTTKKLKESRYDCPQGCKSITLSVVGGTKLVAQ
jgi:hypothetical protein